MTTLRERKVREEPVQISEVLRGKVQMLPHVEHVAVFCNLQGKVIGGFSWGEGAPNMSTSCDTDGKAAEHTREWMEKLHLPSQIARISSSGKEGLVDNEGFGVMEITQEMLDQYQLTHEKILDTSVKADFIYTKDPRITLMVKPADCSSVIVYAVDKYGEKIVGIGHWGREGVDTKNPYKAFYRLVQEEGCDPKNIFIGVAPGIGSRHHTLTTEEIFFPREGTKSKLTNWMTWGSHLYYDDADGKWHIDLLGRIMELLQQAHIPKKNIVADTTDTYEEALAGRAFSHRASLVEKLPEGRMVVAAALPFLAEE